MLLNLSNHPSSTWPERQIQVAEKLYGPVQDMTFPQIDPYAGEQDILDLAAEYLDQVLKRQPKAVHVMGELTFTFGLVALLQSQGITCLASTTHRSTQDLPDGTKISKFEFVKFRKY